MNNVNTTTLTTATAMVGDTRPPCCTKIDGGISEYLIPATLRLRNNATVIHVLIDTGCLQTNIINTRVADLLNADGGTLYKTDIILTAGVGGRSYGVQGVMNMTLALTNHDDNQTQRHIFLRAIVCRDVLTDLIIGLPSILYFDLLPYLQSYNSRTTLCEMCAIDQPTIRFDSPVAQTSALTDLNILNVNEPQRIPNPCKINVTCDVTESDLCNDIIPPIAQQHLTYGATEEGLFYHIQSQADTTFLP